MSLVSKILLIKANFASAIESNGSDLAVCFLDFDEELREAVLDAHTPLIFLGLLVRLGASFKEALMGLQSLGKVCRILFLLLVEYKSVEVYGVLRRGESVGRFCVV